MEQTYNAFSTTLAGNINGSSDPVTFSVTSATNAPIAGNFRVLIGTEILKVTSVSGTSFTASRAQEGSPIAAHSIGDTVTGIQTKGSIDQILLDLFKFDSSANRPTVSDRAKLFIPSDFPGIELNDGTNWKTLFNGQQVRTSPISLGSFSWFNQSTASSSDKNGKVLMTFPTGVDDDIRGYEKNLPSVPYTLKLDGQFAFGEAEDYSEFFIYLRNSTSDEIITLGVISRSSNPDPLSVTVDYYTDRTSFSANYYRKQVPPASFYSLRLEDDNTNWKFSFALDGINYFQVYSRTRNNPFTPNKVGFGGNCIGTAGLKTWLLGWEG